MADIVLHHVANFFVECSGKLAVVVVVNFDLSSGNHGKLF